jgi:sulfite reductase (NADPH) flavoprotein alpha-component
MDCWYFAYGSNMSRTQMAKRTGPIREGDEAPRVALLRGYRFAFTTRSTDGLIYANIMAGEPADVVRGVLYRCGPAAMEILDDYEAGYERRQVTVTDEAGRPYEATVYVALPKYTVEPGRPTTRYRDIVLAGAREFGLPEEYLAQIERLANVDS